MNIEEYKIEITIILVALFCTISVLLISNQFPNKQILALTILTLLLPTIYQIGHIISKEYIRAKNEHDFSILQNTIEIIKEENKDLKEILKDYGIEFEEEN
ncbi:hypothetical protein KAT36_02865 [Candidatus Pacearchaeota archaeon]|nr:hypothetical protein [Candidatus Pacearchaeota archaeon]